MIAVMTEEQYNAILPALPSAVKVGVPLVSQDGRRAICHEFTEEDVSFLQASGATVAETLPGDWQYRQE